MQSPGNWSVDTIAGKTADVYEPPGAQAYEAAIIYLHDVDLQTLANDEVFTPQLTESRLACVCPHGGLSWWLDVVCRRFDEDLSPLSYVREQIVPWIEARWKLTPPAIGLLGTGMGGQGVLQLAYRHARTFPVVAAISPAVDFHILHGQGGPLDEMFASPEAARQQTATLHLHPLNWPPHQLLVSDPSDPFWFEGCQRLASKLSSIGIPFESDLESSTSGDRREYAQRMLPRCVSFLVNGLDRVHTR